MEQVLLKSRIGPHEITYRPLDEWGVPQRIGFAWNFDNDFRCAVPLKWWEEVRDKVMDRDANLTFGEAFLPLQRITT